MKREKASPKAATRAAERALRECEERLRDFVALSGDSAWKMGLDFRFSWVSFPRDLGIDPGDLVGKTRWEFAGTDPDKDSLWRSHREDLLAHKPFRDFRYRMADQQGRIRYWRSSGIPIFGADGVFSGYRGVAQEETALIEAVERAEKAEAMLRDAIDSISEGFVIYDAEDRLVMCNQAYRELYAQSAASMKPGVRFEDILRWGLRHSQYLDAIGREEEWLEERLQRHGEAAGMVEQRLADGRWVAITERRMKNGGIAGLRMDITALKGERARREYLSHYDRTTGLPNKALFHDRIGQAIKGAVRNGKVGAVAVITVEHLERIHDTHGPAATDALLLELAHRVKNTLRRVDTVARLSGEQFGLLLMRLAEANDALVPLRKVLAAIERPFDLGRGPIRLEARCGIAVFPNDGTDPSELIRQAHTALHNAGRKSGDGYQFYVKSMTEGAERRLQSETELRQAIENGELDVYFQPRVSPTAKIVGAEALVRWRHPARGLVLPGEFIPLAEQTGLIEPLYDVVLRKACAYGRAWQRQGLAAVPLSVNLSKVQLSDSTLANRVLKVIREEAYPPEYLEFELTESAILERRRNAFLLLHQLNETGVRFVIDDFGVEHSALNHLIDLPISTVKVDRSFVSTMTVQPKRAAVVQAIISMAHALGLRVVAEGVETKDQATFLRAYGCDELQGFLFSPAVPAAEFEALLARGNLTPSQQSGAGP